jgi:hypothetical protein
MMKRWMVMLLVPLALSQEPALAQVAPDPVPGSSTIPSNVAAPVVDRSTDTNSTRKEFAKPTLVPVELSKTIHMNLVNCGWWDCWLTPIVLPSSTRIDSYQLWFDNTSSSPIGIEKTVLVSKGQQPGGQLSSDTLKLANPAQTLAANQKGGLSLQVARQDIPPEQYEGDFHLMLAGRNETVTLPLMVNVRTGPLGPIVALFLGVVLGRLLKYMQDRGGPQAEKLRLINRLEADLGAADPGDQKLLANALINVRKLVFREELEKAGIQIDLIRGRLDVLQQVQGIEKRLAADETGNLAPFIEQLQRVRGFLGDGEDDRAKRELEALQADLDGAKGDATVAELSTAAGQAAQSLTAIVPMVIKAIPPSRMMQLRQGLVWIAGVSDELRAEATLWVVRPLLSIGLLVGLSLVGVNELYVEKGTSLGAKPLSDYWGLILWGLSADVASRSLSNLKGQPQR